MTLLDAEILQRRISFGRCIKSLRLTARLSQETPNLGTLCAAPAA